MSHLLSEKSFAEAIRTKYIDPSQLVQKVKELKSDGSTIVTLNGSFDLMHAGHLEMIYQASLQADVLIVALNTDRSIQTYKSPLRPIIPLEYRLQMMAALEMVDYVTWFDDTLGENHLKAPAPDTGRQGGHWIIGLFDGRVRRRSR